MGNGNPIERPSGVQPGELANDPVGEPGEYTRQAPAGPVDARLVPKSKRNVQNAPQTPANGKETQAQAVEARAPVAGDAAGAAGIPAAGNAAAVQPEGESGRPTASWVIRDKASGNVLMETYDKAKVDALNTEKYEAVPIQQHLIELNAKIKADAAQPTPADQRLTPVSQRTESANAQTPKAIEASPPAQTSQAEVIGPVGRNNVPLSEGGKPYKTKLGADTARKTQPMMRVQRVAGGYALIEKTPAQIAAQEKAAKRLSQPRTSPKGEPIPAHAMIAAAGGLTPDSRSDMGMDGNVTIGNRKLFAGAGRGLTIEQATEKLIEEGYLQEGASHDQARDLIKRSLTNPQYTPEGTERMAEKELQEREKAFNDEQEALALAQEADDTEYEATVAAFEAAMLNEPQAEAQGDMSMEDALLAAGYTEQEISNERSETEAIGTDAAAAGALAQNGQGAAEAAPGRGAQGDAGRDSAANADQGSGGEGLTLTAPSRQEVLAQQAAIDAEAKRKEEGGQSKYTGLTPAQFIAELAKAFGAKVAERLQAKGVVVPLADQSKLPAHVVPFLRDGDIIYGFYDPKTDRTYAVLENLTPEMVKGLVLHEVGVHFGFEAMLGEAKYNSVMKRLDFMRRAGNKAVKEAYAEAQKNSVRDSQVPEEQLAYLVQNAPKMGIIKEIIARIKAFLFSEFGIGDKYLTEADLTMLARAAVDHSSRVEDGGSVVPAFMRGTSEAMTNSNGARGLTNMAQQDNFDPDQAEAQEVQSAIEGGSMKDAAKWLVKNGTPVQKAIAERIVLQLDRLTKAGIQLDLRVVHRGELAPIDLLNARGLASFKFDNKTGNNITVILNGADVEGKIGTSKEILLHELVHAATMGVVHLGRSDASSRVAQDVKDLRAISLHIARHFDGRLNEASSGGKPLSAFETRIRDRANNAFTSLNETLAWALSNPDAQVFLEGIPYKNNQSTWSAFVTTIRNLLGLPAKLDSALSEVLRVADNLMSDRIDDVIRMPGIGEQMAYQTGINEGMTEAIDSNGAFSRKVDQTGAEANPDIRFSRTPTDDIGLAYPGMKPPSDGARLIDKQTAKPNPHSWDAPEPSQFDDLVYRLQDKQIDTKRVTQAIRELSGQLADEKDVYLQEELFHGRAAARTEDFVNKELGPLVMEMKMRGIDIPTLDEYLHARHAEEANALIADREPSMPDGGSGMTNKAARDYMAKLPAAERQRLEAVAAKVDSILGKTRQMYADYHLESDATVKGWGQMFKHYVPLMREDKDGGMGIGQGFSIKGKETKGRTGSTRKVVDILANIAMQRERAIVRGEKNHVATALVGLATANPNPEFWHTGPPPTERVYDPKTNSVVDRADPLYKSRENVVVAKVKQPSGEVKEVAVSFNEDNERAMRMAAALKNLDASQLNGVLGVSAKITRYFAAINTQYNPIFGTVNLVRDFQGALLNLSTTPLKNHKTEIAGHTLSALKGIYLDARAAREGKPQTSAWATLWEEFQAEGGQTGYRDMFASSNDRAKAIEHELNPTKWMDSPLGKVFTAGGALKVPLSIAQKKAAGLFNWLSDYNLAMENAVRLSAYKVGLEQGMSKQQAASLAKNLTVNFNRKGQVGQQAGALYAFFNASMQGSARLGKTLFDMDGQDVKSIRLSSTGKKIVYGGMLLGTMQALLLAAAGFDDEEPPDFVRERSLIIPTGGKSYITIPMPLGLHVLPNMGRIPTEFALGGFKQPAKHIAKLLGLTANAFNPVGGGASLVQMLSPTAIDPIVALAENKDWTGKPIAKTSYNKATPGHALVKDTASAPSKVLSEAINLMTGGTKYTAGVFSPTPDQIDYLWGQATGGVGRELSKVQQTASATITGEDLPVHKIPLVGRFYGNAETQSAQSSKFYATINRLNEHEAEIKGLQKDRKGAELSEYLAENPEARLFKMANAVELEVQKMRRMKREMLALGAPQERIKTLEERITARMTQFNQTVARLKTARETATAQ